MLSGIFFIAFCQRKPDIRWACANTSLLQLGLSLLSAMGATDLFGGDKLIIMRELASGVSPKE